MRRCLIGIFGGVALFIAALLLFAAWLLQTGSGLRFAAAAAERLSGGQLMIDAARGRIAGPLRVGAIRVETPDLRLRIRGFSLDWNPAALFDRHLDVAELVVDDAEFSSRPSDEAPAPATPPDSLELPLSLSVRALRVGRFAVIDWSRADGDDLDALSESPHAAPEAAPAPVATNQPAPAPGAASAPDPAAAPEAVPAGTAVAAPAKNAASQDVQADSAALPVAEGSAFQLSALSAALASDGRHHRVEGLQVTLPFGRVNA